MIVGLGVDMEEITRLGDAIKRHGRIFLERIFTPAEIAYCQRHRDAVERYAARFAAKEATMKALGTGWGKGVRWRDIEVTRQPGGRPTIVLHGAAREHAERMGARHISLSISHSGNFALAEVILEN
ncbi:MAG: holo-[acyl-carrier-protein] synthase [Acidobacteria bacterium]|nr:MAG: holo-[acyl-carrier-protein] synthase [Acidobacteriota bacterium]